MEPLLGPPCSEATSGMLAFHLSLTYWKKPSTGRLALIGANSCPVLVRRTFPIASPGGGCRYGERENSLLGYLSKQAQTSAVLQMKWPEIDVLAHDNGRSVNDPGGSQVGAIWSTRDLVA